jgi:hypothetical protein
LKGDEALIEHFLSLAQQRYSVPSRCQLSSNAQQTDRSFVEMETGADKSVSATHPTVHSQLRVGRGKEAGAHLHCRRYFVWR